MPLMMSVSGVRGVIGESMTPTLAAELGCAWGSILGGGRVVVGRDSRPSGLMLQQAMVSGLAAAGCDVIQVGVASTPAIALMVRKREAKGGVIITASHNPKIWNGIKFITNEGLAPPSKQAQQVFDLYHNKTFKLAEIDQLGTVTEDLSANENHVETALELVDANRVAGKGFPVVLDSINGAGAVEGRLLLEKLGCKVAHLNGEPTGHFAHTPEPTADNLGELCRQVGDSNAQVGFAQDPDADRCAIVDENGNYIGEEYTLALAAKYLFNAHPGPAAANLSTSRMIDDLAAESGGNCQVYRSPVGEANVVQVMREHGCQFGGEGNGGIIDLRVGPVRDSLVAMALILQLMADSGKSLSKLVSEIPRYVMIKQKFECDRERIDRALGAVREKYAGEKINDSDGVRVDFEDGWIHVRASNTEPIIRIISEAPKRDRAESLIKEARAVVDSV